MSTPASDFSSSGAFGDFVEAVRVDANRMLEPGRRATLGQFFTPLTVARLIAGLSLVRRRSMRLLDPGAGVGALAAAWVRAVCDGTSAPAKIHIVAYELDNGLVPSLRGVLDGCRVFGASRGVEIDFEIRVEDFIRSAVQSLNGGLFGSTWPKFDVAILNPPYRKFRTDSPERLLLREVGVETSNLYAAFVSLALRGLTEGGELLAITPRSFCNGPYFTPFRRDLLKLASLTHMHAFDSRSHAFAADEVLQENVVFRVERGCAQAADVQVEWSPSGEAEHTAHRRVPFSQVVRPEDEDEFIHIAPDEWDTRVAEIVRGLRGTLESIGLGVSTGRVVDFRAKSFLRSMPTTGTVPLIYPTHLGPNGVDWPKPGSKKPNALLHAPETESQINPTGTYVLVKRFSSKEERRRIAATVFRPDAAHGEFVAFENHLNYFHRRGRGLPSRLAAGLTAYLNSSLVDRYFRQFNGHTQVNATDLRKLPYPAAEQLERIGELSAGESDQSLLDEIVEGELIGVASPSRKRVSAQRRVADAQLVLGALGLPAQQTNERAALTLLALVQLRPRDPWSSAKSPLCGVTPIMEFVAEHYGKRWKPNTRETVRRFTLHQFQEAGVVVPNPDEPDRPVNSPAYCYQISEAVLALIRTRGTGGWDAALRKHLASGATLAAKYASEREMALIPLRVGEGSTFSLSPGGQNKLIQEIVSEFCPRHTPGAKALYVGDARDKWGFFDENALRELGIEVDKHGKMPDVVVHFTEKNWLILVEAVTSHGPVSSKRKNELRRLFKSSSAPLVFVSAFHDRRTLNKYLSEIAWETEVWVADSPSHMIHFNGERFLGPYE